MRNNKKESRQHVVDSRQGKAKNFLSTVYCLPSTFKKSTVYSLLSTCKKGFSLVELLVALAIFSVIIAVVFESYITQLKHTSREYRVAETEIETGIAKGIIERDLNTAGYGLADDYGAFAFNPTPKAAAATNGDPDTLTLMGTALGLKSRAAQGWTYMTAADAVNDTASFQSWGDAREDVQAGDVVILMEPSSKKLLDNGTGVWLFYYNGAGANVTVGSTPNGAAYAAPSVGTLAYGLYTSGDALDANVPYYAVRYYIGTGTAPSNCASGTNSLLRAESRNTTSPVCTTWPCSGDPILDCVLDFEVAFGLNTDEDKSGRINIWDNGGQTPTDTSVYSQKDLINRLKQIRLYILVQSGNYDPNYTYPLTSVWVGDSILGTGRSVNLTTAQRNYRWKLISISITPRNIK